MISYIVDLNSIDEFSAWSGGANVLDDIAEDHDALIYINDWLEEACRAGEHFTDTQLNDFLWFDARDILIDAGIWEEE